MSGGMEGARGDRSYRSRSRRDDRLVVPSCVGAISDNFLTGLTGFPKTENSRGLRSVTGRI